MAEEQRQKTRQFNFRLPPELSERFESHCENSNIPMQQFFENAVRRAIGEPLTIPAVVLGVDSHNEQPAISVEALIEAKLAPVLERLEALESGKKTSVQPLRRVS